MRYGFSLVELSIVLVILGLLTGGILAGQSLIRASELRAVTAEYQRYRAAMNTFRDKYFALPGDMPNAVRFWGAQAGATTDGYNATCAALITAATGTATCNGNFDGMIANSGTYAYESYRGWQHLANAGLIEGSYSGVTASGDPLTFGADIGVNTPKSKIQNTGYTFRYYPTITDPLHATYFLGNYGNMMWFGIVSAGNGYTAGGALKPEEAWNIDTKLDDGKPAYGMLRSYKTMTNCHTNTDPALSEYDLSNTNKGCAFMMMLGV